MNILIQKDNISTNTIEKLNEEQINKLFEYINFEYYCIKKIVKEKTFNSTSEEFIDLNGMYFSCIFVYRIDEKIEDINLDIYNFKEISINTFLDNFSKKNQKEFDKFRKKLNKN